MKIKIWMTGLFLVGLLAAAAGAQEVKEGGTYTMTVAGQPAGSETYESVTTGDETKTVSKVGEATFTTVTRNERPAEFSIETNGAKALTATFAGGEAVINVAGKPPATVKTAATVVLENGVWSQLKDLLRQYDRKKGGVQELTAFLPSRALELALTLELKETRPLPIGGRDLPGGRFELVNKKSGTKLTIWANAASNIPLLIEIPTQAVAAVRKGMEEIVALVAPVKAPPRVFNGEFTSEDVSFPNGENTLAGTLTLPKGAAGPVPAVVVITGSGSQDRDGSTLANLYKIIAESLSKAGVAVLRVDDRGVGKSTINKEKAPETSYRDLVSDTRAAFDYLTGRREIDPKRIALAGHSEGSETALTLAVEDPRVAAVILLAGSSRPIDQSVVEQELYQRAMDGTADAADAAQIAPVAQTLIRGFEAAKDPANKNNGRLAWFRDHLASDPARLAAEINRPVLIVQGERDALVLSYHAIELARAFVDGGNRRVSLRIVRNATHIFTLVSDNPQEAPKISDELLTTLQNWAATNLVETAK
ncbi:MAG: alpha/beta hydrolase [Acidobacteria bacterium]|nr:alpha/beta hydrolase [Acidobacteriota bacterium]